jgi:hypothetical protein
MRGQERFGRTDLRTVIVDMEVKSSCMKDTWPSEECICGLARTARFTRAAFRPGGVFLTRAVKSSAKPVVKFAGSGDIMNFGFWYPKARESPKTSA